MKKSKYYINGFREGKSYFYSFGFTESERESLERGEIVKKGDNEFWIEYE